MDITRSWAGKGAVDHTVQAVAFAAMKGYVLKLSRVSRLNWLRAASWLEKALP